METRGILVSGGTGFIGQAITSALLKKQYTVRVLSRHVQKAGHEIVKGDITQPETLAPACQGIDLVIQCAQFPGHPFENRRRHHTYFEVDALGTENLAKAAKAAGVKHFIYLSGAGTDGKKREPWFKAKWYAEQAIHGAGLPATIVRPSWVYGPEDKSLNRILKMAKILPMVPLFGGGGNHVQPLYVEDLAGIVAACVATAGEADRFFDAGGPEELKMKTMLKIALRARGIKALFLSIPKWLVRPLIGQAIDFITMDVHLDIRPLQNTFPNIRLRTLEEGLKSY